MSRRYTKFTDDNGTKARFQVQGVPISAVVASFLFACVAIGLCSWALGKSFGNDNDINMNRAAIESNDADIAANTALTNEVNSTLTASLIFVNASLCDKVMVLDARVTNDLEMLLAFLNITNMDAIEFVSNTEAAFQELNQTLMQKIVDGDDNLQNQITVLEGRVTANEGAISTLQTSTVQTVEGVNPVANNIDLVGDGLAIQPNVPMAGSINLVTDVKTVEGVNGVGFNGNVDMAGMGGITINTGGPRPANQVEVDGTVLETAINNLDSTVSMQAGEISALQAKDMLLMNQISALNITAQIIIDMGEGQTAMLNMTLEELISDVMGLDARVAALESAASAAVASGTILPWSGTEMNIPVDFLLCDGSCYEQATYPVLYSVIGNAYDDNCTGTQFGVPNLKGKVPVGMKTGSANFGTRGQQSGEETHTLSTTELPAHTHGVGSLAAGTSGSTHDHRTIIAASNSDANSMSRPSDDPYFNNGVQFPLREAASCSNTGSFPYTDVDNCYGIDGMGIFGDNSNGVDSAKIVFLRTRPTADGSHTHTITGTTGSAGSGSPHNNVQPSTTIGTYIIKT